MTSLLKGENKLFKCFMCGFVFSLKKILPQLFVFTGTNYHCLSPIQAEKGEGVGELKTSFLSKSFAIFR